MAETLKLEEQNNETYIANAANALREGRLLIAPLEHGYVFVADAFNHAAVKKMHIMRGDDRGVAAQVIVGDIKTATGVTNEFGATTRKICEKFWPGLLTLKIAPAQGLVWDLGDDRSLEEIALRVPATEFLREVALATGPLAVASASRTGMPPNRKGRLFPLSMPIMRISLMQVNYPMDHRARLSPSNPMGLPWCAKGQFRSKNFEPSLQILQFRLRIPV